MDWTVVMVLGILGIFTLLGFMSCLLYDWLTCRREERKAAVLEVELVSARAVSPGAIIQRELRERDWSQKLLADLMGWTEQAVGELINGEIQITYATAVQLAAALGTSIALWECLEAHYQLHLTREKG